MNPSTKIFALLGLLTTFGCAELTPYASEDANRVKTKQLSDQSADIDAGDVRELDPTNCRYDITDIYEPGARFQRGPWTGECLNTEKRRPVFVLNSATQNPDELLLANVFHRDGFWIAAIPLDAVEAVYFQLEYFPAVVPAGHTQIRVEFNQDVELFGQSEWKRDQYETVRNLVLSVEAVTRLGDNYDLFRGMKNHFGVAFRVTSLQARYQSMITEQNHHVEQWRLQMTPQEQRDLVEFFAYESEALGLSENYHTLFRNCTTEGIRALDGVVQYTAGEQIKRFLLKVTEFYPNIVRAALIARGLLPFDQSTDWHALEDDPSYEHTVSWD